MRDISKSGIRIQGNNLELQNHQRIAIRFALRGKMHSYYAKVVRVGRKMSEDEPTEYGCELLTHREYQS